MAGYREIAMGVEERVATITFNRPERLNTWTRTMEAEFRDAIGQAAASEDVRAIVVTGAGRGFCAGAEIANLDAAPGAANPPAAAEPTSDNLGQRYSYLLNVPKPIIAAINGPTAGVGFCIALYCDVRYMASGTRLTTAFARRGLAAEHGSAWMLPRLIGLMNANDLLLSARTVTAEEAEALGLVRTLPVEGFLPAVQRIAWEYANLSSPRSMAIIKRQIVAALFQDLAAATQLSEDEAGRCQGTEDLAEGIAHHLQKRRPNFTGR